MTKSFCSAKHDNSLGDVLRLPPHSHTYEDGQITRTKTYVAHREGKTNVARMETTSDTMNGDIHRVGLAISEINGAWEQRVLVIDGDVTTAKQREERRTHMLACHKVPHTILYIYIYIWGCDSAFL